ncbi:MAG TPA: methyltransferase, partial [Thermomicrobiales bacterium]|nr:methyltransferase [Thermomicrobiales bacterium]
MTEPELPIKKSVSLAWREHSITLDVAQELFSSHQVDRGSRMLLDSLDVDAFGVAGHAADFGCGYGVLGIAWQAVRPAWSMTYVDRDALAVAFTRHNLSNLDEGTYGPVRLVCDISLPYKEAGYDLVLWNVPGKAGREVIAGLLDVVVDALAAGGLLAVVVVHPLADLFTDAFVREDAT